MDQEFFTTTTAWLTGAGVAGTSEADIVSGFCRRCLDGGLPLGRCIVFIDTLHPVHEGRLYQWDHNAAELRLLEYGRTDPAVLEASGSSDNEAVDRWRRSPFYRMLQTGELSFRLRLDAGTVKEFSLLPDWLAAGLTDYLAMICRFDPEGIIGEMDGVYMSWATPVARGFSDRHIAALTRLAPSLALAFKAAALQRMTRTLMETYLGRDAGQRVLSGRIVRGMAERIDAVILVQRFARFYAHH
jgi:adenylate cyclase